MKEPRRLAEGGDSEELAELVRNAQEDVPSKQELSALAASLGPLVGGGIGVGAGAASAGASGSAGVASKTGGATTAAAGGGSAYKILLGVAGLCAIGGVAVYGALKTPAEQPVDSPNSLSSAPVATASIVATPAEPRPPKAEAPPASGSQTAPTPHAAPGEATAKAAPKIPSESQLLRQARAALKTNPKRALSLTRLHQRHYPRGVLSQEREVLAIEALQRLGDESAARERANTFEKAHPGSAHLPKLKSASKPRAPKK